MFGIIIYIYFLLIGFLYADMLFKDRDIYFKIWSGGVIGNVISMAGIVPFAFIFKFSYLSHILLIIFAVVPYAAIWFRNGRQSIFGFIPNKSVSAKKNAHTAQDIVKSGLTNKIFIFLVLPITLLICILMTNHILAPMSGGGVASGQSTYGDLQMHLGFVTSIAEQKNFPPEYNLLQGTRLNYPFFIDMLSSSLYLFKTPLRWAVLIPSYMFAFLLVMGFYIFSYSLTKRKSVAVLSTVFIFLNGAFGFAYFLEGAKADSTAFTRIFTEYYKTPTNLNEMNIRWANTICDMIIPQRTTMAGWCVILFALWLLTEAFRENKRKIFIILGILAGCMPMIHTHSFLALAIISAVLLAVSLYRAKDKKECLINWSIYACIALAMSLPQLIIWTFSQTSGNDSFLNFKFNWVNDNDPYLWFWIKNWGLVFLFIIPTFLNTSKDNKALMAGGALIFVIAELILFQPNAYDQNKLFFITYFIAVILTTEFFVNVYEKLNGVRGRQFIAGLVVFVSVFSGVLTIIREWKSGADYQTFSDNDLKYAEFIKNNTAPNDVFITGTDHLNPITCLAGRTIYVGSSLYVYFHGLGNEYYSRTEDLKRLYEGSYDEIKSFANEHDISYINVSDVEMSEYNINMSEIKKFEEIYSDSENALYKIN